MAKALILVVDDEPNIRKLLAGVLEDEGYAVTGAPDVAGARARLAAEPVELLLLDVQLPDADGLALLAELAEAGDHPPVIMMSGHGTIQTALEAVRLGALDFIEKPLQPGRLLVSIASALDRQRLRDENAGLRAALGATGEILGDSPVMRRLRETVARSAASEARVLVTGENGTGKELVARALHAGSARRARPFVKVNCAAIPGELLESELFGHEKGAFTGAVARRRGKFERAQGGTLLLDEIGDLAAGTQAKLLRVLEEGELERLGGEQPVALDVRVLASTNRDLEALMASGAFRQDLYHRLKVIPIQVPPLREHAEDVALLARHFLEHFRAQYGRRPRSLAPDALAALAAHGWPGNVRELRNLMERLVIMVDAERLELAHLAGLLGESAPGGGGDGSLAERLEGFERAQIRAALDAAGGNVAAAARALGVDRGNLHRRLQRLGLKP
ncbi:MAG: sigma-54 dependent transcriptional regulator [Candidatus Krumholzibacteriia bacterium]|nr:sigma-54-dependent Fis family transcriptional regulator [bacterium]MCB9514533.1 sigma-54-dependent Fis family transcriptional regulator [Candidatus Latescibacterota bacterium]